MNAGSQYADTMAATPLSEDPDRQLFERARTGDRDAQNDLFERHLAGVHAWVRLKRGVLNQQRESAMDVVQSTFRQVLQDLHKIEFRGSQQFRNLLLTYAQNRLRNREQFDRAARRSPAKEADASLSQLYGTICSPSQHLSGKEQIAAFEAAFQKLSESDQEIVLLARFEELPHAEIAARLGVSESASKKALSRALVRLATHQATAAERGA